MSYHFKLPGTVTDHLREIQVHLNRCDPAVKASIATLIWYSVNHTIETFRHNPAQLLKNYKNHQRQKTEQQTTRGSEPDILRPPS